MPAAVSAVGRRQRLRLSSPRLRRCGTSNRGAGWALLGGLGANAPGRAVSEPISVRRRVAVDRRDRKCLHLYEIQVRREKLPVRLQRRMQGVYFSDALWQEINQVSGVGHGSRASRGRNPPESATAKRCGAPNRTPVPGSCAPRRWYRRVSNAHAGSERSALLLTPSGPSADRRASEPGFRNRLRRPRHRGAGRPASADSPAAPATSTLLWHPRPR